MGKKARKLKSTKKGTKVLIEVCADSVESAVFAEKGGAGRLELCADMAVGGITPSAGMIAEIRARVKIPVYVMIRPRGGNFVYSDAEYAVMLRDIEQAKALGADGVVLGLLKKDGTVDIARTRRLVEAARPLDVTFHRAVDASRDPVKAIDALIRTGVDRVLTSGGAKTALAGARTIAAMKERAAGALMILPGGKINPANVARVIERTGAREVHVWSAGPEIRELLAALRD